MWFAVICNILKTAYFEIIVCVFVRSSTTGALSVAVWCVCVCVCVGGPTEQQDAVGLSNSSLRHYAPGMCLYIHGTGYEE